MPKQLQMKFSPKAKPRIIVLARMEESELRKTGKYIQRDRNYFPEMESVAEPHSLMYINRERKGDLAKAERVAAAEGYDVLVYPAGTKKPLEKAKQHMVELYGS